MPNPEDPVTVSWRNRNNTLTIMTLKGRGVLEKPQGFTDNTSMTKDIFNSGLERYHEDLQNVGGNTAIAVFDFMKTYEAYPEDATDAQLKPQKDANDTVATDEMVRQINLLPYRVDVTTAEGLKDIANGADIPHINGIHGKGGSALEDGEKVDKEVIVDPLEGTTLSVKKLEGVTIATAEVEPGGVIEVPDTLDTNGSKTKIEYMDKLFAPGVAGLSIDDEAHITVAKVKSGLRIDFNKLRVTILNRPRNQHIIDDLRQFEELGLVLNLIDAGDLLPSVMASDEPGPDGMYNIVMGVGGVPEGLIAAAAAKATGKTFVEAKWWSKNEEERRKYSKALTLNELIPASADSILVDLAHVTPDSTYTGQGGVRKIKNGHLENHVDFTSVDINGIRLHTKSFQSN
jgi:fructose-1,6-bisphosphatase II